MFLIVDSGIHAQQGYWFQKHFIELESNNSSQYYVQLIGEDTPKEERISIIKELFLLLSLVLGDKIDMKEIVIFSLVFGVVVNPLTDWIAKKYKLGL